jgi:hypothetical protein
MCHGEEALAIHILLQIGNVGWAEFGQGAWSATEFYRVVVG